MTRKVGRPRMGDSFLRVRISHEQLDALGRIAAIEGVPKAELIRRAVAQLIAKHERAGRRSSA
jgi:predicted DNA binding CopG/RHH family protein